MTQEEKELVLKDLCARLLYKPYVEISDGKDWYLGNLLAIEIEHDKLCGTITNNIAIFEFLTERVKLYLRSLSSMTDKEKKEIQDKHIVISINTSGKVETDANGFDWLNKHHFDYRGLIPMGLALEATKDMYNTKTE